LQPQAEIPDGRIRRSGDGREVSWSHRRALSPTARRQWRQRCGGAGRPDACWRFRDSRGLKPA